jgi:hypothetical protein
MDSYGHAYSLLRSRDRSPDGPDRHPVRLGQPPPRPRRRDLRRRARPRRLRAGGVRPRPRHDLRRGRRPAQRVLRADQGPGARAPRRHDQRQPQERQDRSAVPRTEGAEPLGHAAVPARRRQPVGDHPPHAPRARPAPPGHAAQHDAALQGDDGNAQVPRRQRLHRHRDPDARQVHARRRARLPGAQPRARRQLLRAAAVAPAVQAAADGGRLRPLLPDRQVLPRRGPARRPPARIHADRHRDLLPRKKRSARCSKA